MELVVTGKKDGIEEQLKNEKKELKNMRKCRYNGKQIALSKAKKSAVTLVGKPRNVPKGWKAESEKQTTCTPNNSVCG